MKYMHFYPKHHTPKVDVQIVLHFGDITLRLILNMANFFNFGISTSDVGTITDVQSHF